MGRHEGSRIEDVSGNGVNTVLVYEILNKWMTGKIKGFWLFLSYSESEVPGRAKRRGCRPTDCISTLEGSPRVLTTCLSAQPGGIWGRTGLRHLVSGIEKLPASSDSCLLLKWIAVSPDSVAMSGLPCEVYTQGFTRRTKNSPQRARNKTIIS